MSEIKKSGGNKPLKAETHYKEIKVQQKPVGCYLQVIMTQEKKVKYIHSFAELKKMIYGKSKGKRDAAWAEIKGMPEKTRQKFLAEKEAEEKAYKAKKSK